MAMMQCDCPPEKHAEWCANHPAQRARFTADGKPDPLRFPAGVTCDCPPGTKAEEPIAHRSYCANHPANLPAKGGKSADAPAKSGKPA